MTDFQMYFTIGIFAAVILLIAFDLIDMAVAALLGVSVLIAFGILDGGDLMPIVHTAGGPLALLFGGMVVARMIAKTGIFEWLGDAFLRATGGSGKRLLLLIVALVAPVCALLPNATAVILVAPVIIGVCKTLKVDFVGPMIITAIVSNAAGMLTLVGDPATFLVGSAIGLSFTDYLQMVSLGGLLAVLAVVPLLPLLLPEVWATRSTLPAARPRVAIERPVFLALALLVLLDHGAAVPVRRVSAEPHRSAGGRDHRRLAGAACGLWHARRAGRRGDPRRGLEDAGIPRAPSSRWSRPSSRPSCCRASPSSSTRGSETMSCRSPFCPWAASRSCRACWPTFRWWRPPW